MAVRLEASDTDRKIAHLPILVGVPARLKGAPSAADHVVETRTSVFIASTWT